MKLINADALKREIATVMPSRVEVDLIIDKQPDAIVRCTDCKYSRHVINVVNGEVRTYRVICVKPYGQGSAVHEPDWFCADGERE